MDPLVSILPTFWKVIHRLEQASIQYMLTGSLALNFYGHARATNDIDIVILVSPADRKTLYECFMNDFYVSIEAIQDAFQTTGMFNIIDNESIFKVDLIVAKADPFSQEQFRRRQRIAIGDQSINIITAEDLILSKLEWSQESLSEVQTRDIQNILRTVGAHLDVEYLKHWALARGYIQRLEEIYATL